MRPIDADQLLDFIKFYGRVVAPEDHIVRDIVILIQTAPTIAPPPNDPLTPEQLREMGGEPYCHVGLQDDSPPPHWSILDPYFAKHIEDYGYDKRWIAYRRKPEAAND